jgi:protein TonB
MSAHTATFIVGPVWATAADEKDFRRLLARLLGVTLALSIAIGLIPLPELAREEKERLPVRLAEIILEKKKPKPAPVVIPKRREPKAEKKIVKKKRVEKVIKAPVKQTVRQAREKAKVSGILAFQSELMDMRDAVDVRQLNSTALIQQGKGKARRLDRSLLTSKKGSRQASVNTAELSRETGGVALAGRQTTKVAAPLEETAATTGAVRSAVAKSQPTRSIEEVRRVFDTNKGAIFAIYNRALRKNPGLVGKVVLELVIQPDGSVSECRVVSTEMDDDEMVRKLVRRVQLFNFGTRAATVTRISYPVHFLPS